MKAFTEKFGKVEILGRTGNSLKVELESGEVKTLMPMFIKFKDENGNEITDFSQIEEVVIINTSSSKAPGRKTSKLAELLGKLSEQSEEMEDNKN